MQNARNFLLTLSLIAIIIATGCNQPSSQPSGTAEPQAPATPTQEAEPAAKETAPVEKELPTVPMVTDAVPAVGLNLGAWEGSSGWDNLTEVLRVIEATNGDRNGFFSHFKDHTPNGILDRCEAAMIEKLIADPSMDFSANGGARHADVKAAWDEAIAAGAAYGWNTDFWGVARPLIGIYVLTGDADDYVNAFVNELARLTRTGATYNADDFPLANQQRAILGTLGDADGDGVSNLAEFNAVWNTFKVDAREDGEYHWSDFDNKNFAGDDNEETAEKLRLQLVATYVNAVLNPDIAVDGGTMVWTRPYMTREQLQAQRDAKLNAEKRNMAIIRTSWKLGDKTITFKTPAFFHIESDAINANFPGGLDGQYRIDLDGKITTEMGGTIDGAVWDGEKLVLDGVEAVRITPGE